MPLRRTLELTDSPRHDLQQYRDHDPRPYVRERCAALLKIADGLNALSGRVDYLDVYIIGREKLIRFYQQVTAAYPDARRIDVVQDNWSIHQHADVVAALVDLPQIEPVWLPTSAPWLNPIEKLWRWLREQVLTMHRLAGDWDALRERVNAFLDQFGAESHALRQYVGLIGEGKLAQALSDP